MATLYLIRHGEPTITGVFLGRMDPPLSTKGRTNSALALAGLDVATVYTSPLLRARETASYIPCTRVVELTDLQEVDFGDWTGKTWAEIEDQWTELARRKATDWLGTDAPGAESWSALVDRLRSAYEKIEFDSGPVAVVAHQGVNAALSYIVGGNNPLSFAQRYSEVIELEIT